MTAAHCGTIKNLKKKSLPFRSFSWHSKENKYPLLSTNLLRLLCDSRYACWGGSSCLLYWTGYRQLLVTNDTSERAIITPRDSRDQLYLFLVFHELFCVVHPTCN